MAELLVCEFPGINEVLLFVILKQKAQVFGCECSGLEIKGKMEI